MLKDRYLAAQVRDDLKRKMVFLGGPRQVGKTTLAKRLLKGAQGYLNWDDDTGRAAVLRRELPETELWVFDEVHKYRSWRNFLKGLFDTRGDRHRILVTGSARLDLYRYGGDSLQGRYHFLRLHPLSAAELGMKATVDLRELFELGGFPEPFFSSSQKEARRWTREYRTRLIREDITSLEQIQDLGKLELLMLRLPEWVASPLSLNALREDLEVSHKAVARWVDILERTYGLFRIAPFGAPKIRAVKKEQKHYHFDWNLVASPGPRFENLVACHLLKWVQYQEDTEGRDLELRYFRDIDGREVDFVVMEGRKPVLFIECKLNDDEIGKGLRYLKARFPGVDSWQISLEGKKDYRSAEGIRVAPAIGFLSGLV